MASRPSRPSSIPIPMLPSNPRSIDNAISIPASRARMPPSLSFSPPPLTRSVPRSSSSLTRASARQPYEPRVVRAPSLSSGVCPPPLPASHGRRASSAVYPGRSAPRVSLVTQPEPLVLAAAVETFPRPAYLDHSTFRDALRTEPLAAIPRKDAPTPSTTASYSAASAMTSSTDSDDDISPPPRRIQTTSTPTFVHQQDVFILPTRWSDTDRSNHLTVSQDKRELAYTAGNGDKDGASARTDVPIPPACGIYYYEVEIRAKENKSHISIGFAGPKVKFNCVPGHGLSSWGYHGGDGFTFTFSTQRNGSPYAQTYGGGDTVGCGIDFSTRRAFYTKNGLFLGSVFEQVGLGIELYPSIGLQAPGESICVNFGHEPFKFDIENHVQQQKNAAWNKIMAMPLYTKILNPGGSAKVPLSEEESKIVLNKLVHSYLIHHGYPKTVRAFQKQQDVVLKAKSAYADDRDIEMGGSSPVKRTFVEDTLEDDIERRTRIVTAVAQGDIDLAISETEKYHPAVLKAEASLMFFKLRCRKFVELILATSAMKKRVRQEREREERGLDGAELTGPVSGAPAASSASDGDWLEENMNMDVDDDGGYDLLAPTPSSGRSKSPSSKVDPESIRAGKQRADGGLVSTAQYEAALNAAIAYGQSLSNDYKSDARPEVKQLLKQTFGIVAWEDPIETGGDIAKFVGVQARVKLANELNQAILKSEGRPAQPALETLYRHTSACITQLGILGEGAAAFADLQRELLEA